MNIGELRDEARKLGYELVRADRIKRVSIVTPVSSIGVGMEADEMDYIERKSVSGLGHEIALKLLEFKKTLFRYHKSDQYSPFVDVYVEATLDVIVPNQSPFEESIPTPRQRMLA